MSKELGLAKSTISAYLNGRIRNATIAQQNAILRAYNQQKTIQEIAEEQHVSKSIVEYTISTYRIRSKYEQKLEGYHYVLPKAPKYIVTQLHRGNLIGYDSHRFQMKAIVQPTKDGAFVAEHCSINSAARSVGTSKQAIRCCLRGKSKSCAGYVWKYKEVI